MNKLEYIYIAGPLSQGHRKGNREEAIRIASILADEGYFPFVPHLSDAWEEQHPRGYEDWMAYDFAWIRRCDAVLRIPGYSPGAEREVEKAKMLGLPVFNSLSELFATQVNP